MVVNIDEIYKMLSWDNDITIQNRGIQEAQKIKSLGVLILPILPSDSKSIWENCAKVLISKSDEELHPYLTELFIWLQDMNWPGASLIYDRLLSIPFNKVKLPMEISLSLAHKTNDKPWEMALNTFYQTHKTEGRF